MRTRFCNPEYKPETETSRHLNQLGVKQTRDVLAEIDHSK